MFIKLYLDPRPLMNSQLHSKRGRKFSSVFSFFFFLSTLARSKSSSLGHCNTFTATAVDELHGGHLPVRKTASKVDLVLSTHARLKGTLLQDKTI